MNKVSVRWCGEC